MLKELALLVRRILVDWGILKKEVKIDAKRASDELHGRPPKDDA